MKKNLLICLLFFTCFAVKAQDIISLSATEVEANFQGQDMTNNWLDLSAEVAVTNMTDETIQIKWTRVVPGDCNESWETAICDNNTCYLPTVDTNWGPNANAGNVDVAFELGPNESFDHFAFHIYPRMNTGCCDVTVDFSLVGAPDDVLASVVFKSNVNMNDDCSALTSNQDVEAAKVISAFPSPTSDFFQLTENEVVDQISVYNAIGQLLKTFNYVDGTQYDLSSEANGMYFLQLQNEEGENLKVLRMIKH